MGIWGINPFENDFALDWLASFGPNDFRLIDRTLAGVAALTAADYLDADDACEVLAAAECLAAAGGQPAAQLPDEITTWVQENRPFSLKPAYLTMAQAAVARVRHNSELQALWAESDEYDTWQATLINLQQRLTNITP